MLLDEINPDKIVVSPINLGYGQVRCQHGILPVPAPATAYILKSVPTYCGNIEGELCTPTGAALLKYFADEFSTQPLMSILEIGYGMGQKDFPQANCIRSFLGETKDSDEKIIELVCTLDDITGEDIGYTMELLFKNNAVDVFIVPIQMKKNRPGNLLVCNCKPEDEKNLLKIILKHTSTLGVRRYITERYTMNRTNMVLNTIYGEVNVKKSFGHDIVKTKFEYEDLVKIAKEQNLSLNEVRMELYKKYL